MNDKRMRLGTVLTATGQHVAAWRHRDVPTDMGTNLAVYITAAQTAERGKFYMMFVADDVGVWQRDIDRRGHSSRTAYFEPITLLSALASHTSRFGLVATMTASTTSMTCIGR
jgi:N-acetyl-S-(2-succino)cysteine monooxygenase